MSASNGMSEEIRRKHHHAFPIMDEELKLTARKSSKPQQNLKKMAEQIKLRRGSEGVNYPGKSMVEGDLHSANAGEGSFQRLDVNADARDPRPKSSRDLKNQKVKGDSMENDELVKHMTHLPDYLQLTEWRETLQEKSLNVGVLDWRRLEKFNQKSKALNVAPILNADNISRTALDCDKKLSKMNKLSSESYPGIAPTKRKHQGAASQLGKSSSDFRDCSDRRDEKVSGINRHVKNRDQGMTASASVMHDAPIDSLNSEVSALSKIRQKQDSAGSKEKGIMEDDGISKRGKNQPASKTKALVLDCSAKHPSMVILFPRGRRSISSLEASRQGDCMKKSYQNSKEAPMICCSGTYTGQLSSGNATPECRTTDRVSKYIEDPSQVLKSGNQLPENDNPEKTVPVPKSSSRAGKFEYVDQESAELAARRGPSWSFNLSSISRSFSYKERKSSVGDSFTFIPGGSSLITSADSLLTKEKQKISSKSRFSSLRRLFDPILKYKPATSNSCAEDAQLNLNSSIRRSINSNELRSSKKPGLTFQAVLQLAVLNEGPVLKFMVENNHQILICSTKDLTSSGKHVSSKGAFTFYSLDENKRKSGSWVGQGCKTRSGNSVCSEVGHMCMTRLENSAGHFVEREYVLFSSEMGNSGKINRRHDSNSRAEFAAIVSKVPMHSCKHQNKYIDLVEGIFPWKKCFCDIASDDYGSTTVIIPGAFHSLPDNGEPSSLINRWRSGGSCDCGGWDVGCKLNVLSNKKVSCKMPMTLDSCSTFKCFELILQGESDLNGPIFSLKPDKKGIYSVQFDSFISSLQAFSVCVAFVSSQISSEPLDTSHFTKHEDSGPLSSDRNSAAKHPLVPKAEGPGKNSQPKHLPLTPLDRVILGLLALSFST